MIDVTCVILAGGKSTRMGEDKGLILLNGKPMVQYVIETLEKLGVQIIIIANNKQYNMFGYPVFQDVVHEKGPVGGILTALTYSKTEKNVVISCDAPFINIDVIEVLIRESDSSAVTIPSVDGREYPLIGIYKKQIKEAFHQFVDEDKLRLRSACEEIGCKVVPFSIGDNNVNENTFKNINTQTELNTLEL